LGCPGIVYFAHNFDSVNLLSSSMPKFVINTKRKHPGSMLLWQRNEKVLRYNEPESRLEQTDEEEEGEDLTLPSDHEEEGDDEEETEADRKFVCDDVDEGELETSGTDTESEAEETDSSSSSDDE
jgi:hypothetical protein